jgi:hypothetical protein
MTTKIDTCSKCGLAWPVHKLTLILNKKFCPRLHTEGPNPTSSCLAFWGVPWD